MGLGVLCCSVQASFVPGTSLRISEGRRRTQVQDFGPMGVPICVELWLAPLALASRAVSQPGKGREMSSFALLCSVKEQLPLCCLTSHRDQLSALNPWHRSHHLFFSHLYKLIGGLPCSAISCPSLPPRSWLILGTCRLGCTEQPDQQPCRALRCVAATCAQSLCTDPSPARSPCLCTL